MPKTIDLVQSARIELRLHREQKERIEKAALLSGQSVSDFVTSTMLRQADAVLERHERMKQSDAARKTFFALLDGGGDINKA